MALPEMTDEGLRLTRRGRRATGASANADGLAGYRVRRVCACGGCDRFAMDESRLCRDCWAETEALEEWMRTHPRRNPDCWADRVTRCLFGVVGLCVLFLIVRNLPIWRLESWWP